MFVIYMLGKCFEVRLKMEEYMFSCYNGSPLPKEYAREVSEALLRTDFDMLDAIAREILHIKELNRCIFTAGNGGSAATASHIINDLMKGCRIGEREGFRALCLNDSNAVLTCLANDFCYEDAYGIILRTLGRRGDLLIVFSGSGNSPNILKACETAREMGITVIGFGGREGGKMKELCNLCLVAPTYCMEQIEDLHMFYVHSLISTLRERLKNVWDIEVVHYPSGEVPEFAIFDFDGTVSLLREGWQSIMYDYFNEELLKCPEAPETAEAESIVRDFVDMLTGKQTIFQCIQLCSEIKKYGGVSREPLKYKQEYLHRLMEHIQSRHAELREGEDPTPYLVPGIRETLQALKEIGIKCYLVSGTDEADVLEEVRLLGILDMFESIHGATDANSTVCSKELVIRELIDNNLQKGSRLIAFGDGYVEIELVKQLGGYAVAVATNEALRDTSIDEWKRKRLLKAGADCIIPDFTNTNRLTKFICGRG
jgi:phosphoheptose isomerase/phosphoglycolate phosphatase-like HAD superfamily hydrolase